MLSPIALIHGTEKTRRLAESALPNEIRTARPRRHASRSDIRR